MMDFMCYFRYWNETARQMCPDADESEGITLESLGNYFFKLTEYKCECLDVCQSL